MGWQEVVAWTIVAGAVGIAVRWIWQLVCSRHKGGCASCCNTTCALRNTKNKDAGQ